MPLPALLELIAAWVAADLGVPIPAMMPGVAFADQRTMERLRLMSETEPVEEGNREADLVAFYETRGKTIYLPLGWQGRSYAELSVLVHEMVHHFQVLAEERFACPSGREKLPYEVQRRWLEAHGESLEETLGIDPLYLIVATNCLP